MKTLQFAVCKQVWVLLLAFCTPGSVAQSTEPSASKKPLQSGADIAACKVQLNKIYEAMQQYQKKHRKLPNWLSDLYPEFIRDPKVFICPLAESRGDLQTGRDEVRDEVFLDPVLPISYAY